MLHVCKKLICDTIAPVGPLCLHAGQAQLRQSYLGQVVNFHVQGSGIDYTAHFKQACLQLEYQPAPTIHIIARSSFSNCCPAGRQCKALQQPGG